MHFFVQCFVCECVCVCVLSVGADQPAPTVGLWSFCTSWVNQVLSCPLMPPPAFPLLLPPRPHSVNCHLLPDQYYVTQRTTCHSTSEGQTTHTVRQHQVKTVGRAWCLMITSRPKLNFNLINHRSLFFIRMMKA